MGRVARYSGATGRITLDAVTRLDPHRWSIQSKIDGMYCRICLDSQGRIAHVFSRRDRAVPRTLWADLHGQFVGWPHAELAGELEASTERGNRHAAIRGYRLCHLFDLLHDGRRSLHRDPFAARYDALWRMQSEVECYGPSLPWYRDRTGRAHDARTGDFVKAIPTGWRLTPIVPRLAPARAEELWHDVDRGDVEGLVAVRLDAAIGRRRSKLKCKPVDYAQAIVLRSDSRAAEVTHAGLVYTIGTRKQLAPGQRIEVAFEGFHERSVTPRFARMVHV